MIAYSWQDFEWHKDDPVTGSNWRLIYSPAIGAVHTDGEIDKSMISHLLTNNNQ